VGRSKLRLSKMKELEMADRFPRFALSAYSGLEASQSPNLPA